MRMNRHFYCPPSSALFQEPQVALGRHPASHHHTQKQNSLRHQSINRIINDEEQALIAIVKMDTTTRPDAPRAILISKTLRLEEDHRHLRITRMAQRSL